MASNASELTNIYEDISKKIDLETDSDEDGIPDYYEDHMITFSGYQIPLDKTKKDTDGDGLTDGEEVSVELKYNEDKTKVYVKGKLLGSNPVLKDTDGDTYLDNVDLNPLSPYKTPIILLHGLNDDTDCFGVITSINKIVDNNDNYDSDRTVDGVYSYNNIKDHKIKSVNLGLGKFLVDSGYRVNRNLFAFNYPCHDMVQFNGKRLDTYIRLLISNSQAGISTDVVDGKDLFATKADKDSGNVKFILIGHSMGGLVSRYYIENINSKKVDKLITIDTPHYGSSLANASDATGNWKNFSPAVYDLHTKSRLFGGEGKSEDKFSVANKDAIDYGLEHQSPALKGNDHADVVYYAVGGYAVGRGWVNGELEQLDEELQNTYFGFEFVRSVSDKLSYKNSISSALKKHPNGSNSELDLGDTNGDDVVDYQSQFAIRFDGDTTDGYQRVERTYMIVDATNNHGPAKNQFHNGILELGILYDKVWWFIND